MMSDIVRDNLVNLVKAYARATGRTVGAISNDFYGNGAFLDEYAKDKRSITVRKAEEMFGRLLQEWPDNTPVPPLDHWIERHTRSRRKRTNL